MPRSEPTRRDRRERTTVRSGLRAQGGFRPDIEGLRAIAIGLVLLYHGGVDQITGGFVGVDVFFVISGFLITGLLIRELERDGRISLARFYARRAKRLLPATAVVLVATAVLVWRTVSVIDWRTFGIDIVTAATYVVNWRLAARSVDYLAEDVGVSPVQHFWSLAVEEQFYIVWPLLLVVVAWWVRKRTAARLRAVMTAAILLIVIPSLAYSIYLTGSNPATAFFVTPTRLWELGIGAFVAIGAALWPRLPRVPAAVLGWLGIAAIGISALLYDSSTPWPGYHALLPTLGTAAVIIAGSASGKAGPAGLLSWKPAVWIGGLSYSLYLWHWPLIVCATALWGELGTKRGLLVMAVAFVPAYLCHKLVENPIRFAPSLSASNSYTLSLGATFTLIGVVAGLVLALATPTSTGQSNGGDVAGAEVLTDGGTEQGATGGDGTVESLASVEWFTPAAVDAPEDLPAAYADGCQTPAESAEVITCEYGVADSDTVIALVGDSKIVQYLSAVDAIATEHGWTVITMTKSSCPFIEGMPERRGEPYTECAEWGEAVTAELEQLQPDLVLTSQRNTQAYVNPDGTGDSNTEAMIDGIAARWQTLVDAGLEVAVVLDNPAPPFAVYECVADNPDDLAACTFDRAAADEYSAAGEQSAAAEKVPKVHVISVGNKICPGAECVPVIGNVLIYRQGSHITDTYARTLTPALAAEITAILGD